MKLFLCRICLVVCQGRFVAFGLIALMLLHQLSWRRTLYMRNFFNDFLLIVKILYTSHLTLLVEGL